MIAHKKAIMTFFWSVLSYHFGKKIEAEKKEEEKRIKYLKMFHY